MYNTILSASNMNSMVWVAIIFLLPGIIFLVIFIPIAVVRARYKKFLTTNSVALHNLEEINSRYRFKPIGNYDMEHSYDNENFYNDISCWDYLTYQLVYIQKNVSTSLKNSYNNKSLYDEYKEEVKEKCVYGRYESETNMPRNVKGLRKYEKKLLMKHYQHPVTELNIRVTLKRTNINGDLKERKRETFNSKVIEDTIHMLNQRKGNYYTNQSIWQAICRVERGKVTNRMRFAIYSRDQNRCRMCGRRTNDLEIDHIIPIAKGGKSTMDNLQTLCHRCNVKKGSNIIY